VEREETESAVEEKPMKEEAQKSEEQDGTAGEAQSEQAKADPAENPAAGDDEKAKASLSVDTQQNRQMQFPFAPSNFLAPSPTPIRPLHGDPRAMKQQPQDGDSMSTAGTPTSASGAQSSDTQNNANGANNDPASSSNPVSQAQMFHHQTNAPSFYTTPQDGPPVGPAMVEQSSDKQWQGQPSSAPKDNQNNQNNPSWNAQMNQGAPTARSPSAAGQNVRVPCDCMV
jgi:hypothetical protein